MQVKPEKLKVKEIIESGKNIVPIYTEIPGDLTTPALAYLKLSRYFGTRPSFLLESAENGSTVGRYSFIGAKPSDIVRIDGKDPLDTLEILLAKNDQYEIEGKSWFTGGYVGYVSFECAKYFEPRSSSGRLREVGLDIPEAMFCLYEDIIIFDHLYQVIYIVSNLISSEFSDIKYQECKERILILVSILTSSSTEEVPQTSLPNSSGKKSNLDYLSNMKQEEFEEIVKKLQAHIMEGDIIQAVPSQRLHVETTANPFTIYRTLRQLNPSPYMFFLDMNDFQIIGASPEMMCKVDKRKVFTHPIAGTRKRGNTEKEDEDIAMELLCDIKERSEHVMLVDLGRNDVNRVCKPETVKIDSFMKVEKYRHVMHIVSQVSGQLRDECSAFDAFRSIFPAGTVSGAPKVRALQLIEDLEREKRGVYAGAVGYFGFNGDIDTAIAIRTIVHKDSVAYLQAGAGVVYDSNAEMEYHETMNKLKSNMKAVDLAEKRST